MFAGASHRRRLIKWINYDGKTIKSQEALCRNIFQVRFLSTQHRFKETMLYLRIDS